MGASIVRHISSFFLYLLVGSSLFMPSSKDWSPWLTHSPKAGCKYRAEFASRECLAEDKGCEARGLKALKGKAQNNFFLFCRQFCKHLRSKSPFSYTLFFFEGPKGEMSAGRIHHQREEDEGKVDVGNPEKLAQGLGTTAFPPPPFDKCAGCQAPGTCSVWCLDAVRRIQLWSSTR